MAVDVHTRQRRHLTVNNRRILTSIHTQWPHSCGQGPVIEDLKVIAVCVQPFVGGAPDVQGVVYPGQVAVRATTHKRLGERVFFYGNTFFFRELDDLIFGPDVFQGDALAFIDEEDRALGGVDDLLYLVLTVGSVHPRLLIETMGFIDHNKAAGLHRHRHARGSGLALFLEVVAQLMFGFDVHQLT